MDHKNSDNELRHRSHHHRHHRRKKFWRIFWIHVAMGTVPLMQPGSVLVRVL